MTLPNRVCFEIQVNAESALAAGRPALDVLTAMVTYVRSRNELELSAGGLQRHADGSSEHFEWIVHTLAVGDETRVRVVEVEALAEPISVTREESSKREQSERVL